MKSVVLSPSAESALHSASTLAASSGARTGLLLGQVFENKLTVLACVPTPPRPKAASSESGGGGKGWAASEWFAEHARQARRMLVGGVEIVGLFTADTPASKNATDGDAVREMAFGLPIANSGGDRFHLRCLGNKITAEVFTGSRKENIKPKPITNIKTTPTAGGMITFTAAVEVDVSVAVVPSSASSSASPSSTSASSSGNPASESLKSQVRRGLDSFASTIVAAPALVAGKLFDENASLDKLFDSASSSMNKGGKVKHTASSSAAAASEAQTEHSVEFFLNAAVPAVPAAGAENASGQI